MYRLRVWWGLDRGRRGLGDWGFRGLGFSGIRLLGFGSVYTRIVRVL